MEEEAKGSPLVRRRSSLPGHRASSFRRLAQHRQQLEEPLDLAEGAARSLSLDVDRHFQTEKSTPMADRGVMLLRQAFVPLMGVCLLYAIMYWWLGMYRCLLHHVLAAAIGLVWWLCLLKGFTFVAKAMFLLNWYLTLIVMCMVLTKESGIAICSIVLAGVWMCLFEVDLSRPWLCVLVAVTSSGLWVMLNFCDPPTFLREDLSEMQLLRVNTIMLPLVTITTICFVTFLICWLKRINKERESQLRQECSLVDRIVLGLLPLQIVDRLKRGEKLIADWRPLACILFMDIVGFTEMCSKIPPRQVVQGLVRVFAQVERIVKKYPRIEKVKTIGDAFMCSSGLLDSHLGGHEDVVQVARLALELRDSSFSMEIDDESTVNVLPITFRFGIHCGEVVAGIISKERFTFDVLGDTVNTASRMESTSMPNMIQVSEEIKSRLEHSFEFTDNGVHHVKGKGPMHTYFLVNVLGRNTST
jgi:adenylate cyclase